MSTALFSEDWELLDTINPASYNAEQNTGSIHCGNYSRVVILIHAGVLAGDLDVDIEQQATSGGTPKSFNTNALDITITGTTDNNTMSVIELNPADFDIANGYEYLNVEITPGAAGIFGVQVWGDPRFKPAATTLLNSQTY